MVCKFLIAYDIYFPSNLFGDIGPCACCTLCIPYHVIPNVVVIHALTGVGGRPFWDQTYTVLHRYWGLSVHRNHMQISMFEIKIIVSLLLCPRRPSRPTTCLSTWHCNRVIYQRGATICTIVLFMQITMYYLHNIISKTLEEKLRILLSPLLIQ